jgi:RNA-directed DNA polymerase
MVAAEVRAFVESLAQDLWGEGLRHRGNDGAILRLIRQWGRAGGLAGGTLSSPERGRPQGGGSPMLANPFLDPVREAWCAREVTPRMTGRGLLLRVADEWVSGCEREGEARRMLGVVPKRFARFQRTIHPQKTRLVRFQPPRHTDEGEGGDGPFDVLGLTHDGATSRRGYGVSKRRTAKQRLRRARRAVWPWCRTPRHDPSREPDRPRRAKRRGHYQDDGIRGNDRPLEACSRGVERPWRYGLSRRGGPRPLRGETFAPRRAALALPLPRRVHTSGGVLPGNRWSASASCRHADVRGTGGVHGARPGLWGAWRVTAGSTRQLTASSLRSCVASAAPRA